MSRSIIRTQSHSVAAQRRARSLIIAVSVALSSVALGTAASLAADPDAPGPGSPEWTRHLELEYGR